MGALIIKKGRGVLPGACDPTRQMGGGRLGAYFQKG